MFPLAGEPTLAPKGTLTRRLLTYSQRVTLIDISLYDVKRMQCILEQCPEVRFEHQFDVSLPYLRDTEAVRSALYLPCGIEDVRDTLLRVGRGHLRGVTKLFGDLLSDLLGLAPSPQETPLVSVTVCRRLISDRLSVLAAFDLLSRVEEAKVKQSKLRIDYGSRLASMPPAESRAGADRMQGFE